MYFISEYLKKSGNNLFVLIKNAENKNFFDAVSTYCNPKCNKSTIYFDLFQKVRVLLGYFKRLTFYTCRTPRSAVRQKEFAQQKLKVIKIRLQQFKSLNSSGQKAKELLTNLKNNNVKKKLLINDKTIKLISNQSILLLAYKLIRNKKSEKFFNEEALGSISLE
jgi:hypothetical protein